MLRFGTKTAANRGRLAAGPSRGRVWMLLAMLGAVTLLMRQLQQREAGEQLGRALAAGDGGRDGDVTALREAMPLPGGAAAWSAIEDNAPFLTAEQDAWFSLLAHVRDDEGNDSAGSEVAYAQLASQPEVYRGRLVRVRGTALRGSLKIAPSNDRGIQQYHRLILAPKGGGDLPFWVYTLNLPKGFPRGRDFREPVVVDGYFFKTNSFSDGEQMGLAPVIVAQTIDWRPAKRAAAGPAPVETDRLWMGVVVAAAAAACLAAWVAWQTRRPRVSPAVDADASEAARASLAQLAEAETEP